MANSFRFLWWNFPKLPNSHLFSTGIATLLGFLSFLICHLPFLAGILVFSILHLGLTLMWATASNSYEKACNKAIKPCAGNHDGVSAIGCERSRLYRFGWVGCLTAPCYLNSNKLFIIRAIDIVTPSRIQSRDLWVSVYLNLTHALSHSATRASGFLSYGNLNWSLYIQSILFILYYFSIFFRHIFFSFKV